MELVESAKIEEVKENLLKGLLMLWDYTGNY